MTEAAAYDVLLRGGHVICPASGLDGIMDVAVRNGAIATIKPHKLPSSEREVMDVRSKLVVPGMVDRHANYYRYVTGRFGLDADMIGVAPGVTTVVDQGGPSCMTFPGFRHYVAEKAQTR